MPATVDHKGNRRPRYIRQGQSHYFGLDLCRGLLSVLDEAERDGAGAVLTGTGGCFSACRSIA